MEGVASCCLPLSHMSPRPACTAAAEVATSTRQAVCPRLRAALSTGVITQENRGLRVSIPSGAARHSTRKSAGRTPAELPGGSWAAACPVFLSNGANVVPSVSSCRRVRRLVTVVRILWGYEKEIRAGNVIHPENVGINTTMWNFGLHIRNGKCYLYTNWSFTCEYMAPGHESPTRGTPHGY